MCKLLRTGSKTPCPALTVLSSLEWPQSLLSALAVAQLLPASEPPHTCSPLCLHWNSHPICLADANRSSKSCLKCYFLQGTCFDLPSSPSEVTPSVSPPCSSLYSHYHKLQLRIGLWVHSLNVCLPRGQASCAVTPAPGTEHHA